MTFLDRIIGPIALLAFAGYLGILIWNVPKFGLVVVSVIAVLLAAFDFARSAMIRGMRERAEARRGR